MSTSSERARHAAATSAVINPGGAVGDGADDRAVRLATAAAAAAQAVPPKRCARRWRGSPADREALGGACTITKAPLWTRRPSQVSGDRDGVPGVRGELTMADAHQVELPRVEPPDEGKDASLAALGGG